MGHFGHFILECLSRLWYVFNVPNTAHVAQNSDNRKIVFVITRVGYKSWFDTFFKSMGISKERIIYLDKPTQYRSVIVPEQSMYMGISYTKCLPNSRCKTRLGRFESRKFIEQFFKSRV